MRTEQFRPKSVYQGDEITGELEEAAIIRHLGTLIIRPGTCRVAV